jgi:hypothetical protein
MSSYVGGSARRKTQEEAAQPGKKALTLGLIGSAAIVLPAAAAFASSHPALTALPIDSTTHTAQAPARATLTADVTTNASSASVPSAAQGGNWVPNGNGHTPSPLMHSGDRHRGHRNEHRGQFQPRSSTTSPISVPPMIPYEPNTGWDSSATSTPAAPGTTTTSTASGLAATGSASGTTSAGATTTGSAATGAGATGNTTSSAAALPVFNSSGTQIGTAVSSSATGPVQLVGSNGATLGVFQQQNGAVNLIGPNGAVIGNLTLSQSGQAILTTTATTGTSATASSVTASSTTASSTTASSTTASSGQTPVPVFDSAGTQIGVATENLSTGAIELIGSDGTSLGTIQQQNGAVDLIGSNGAVLGSFAANQSTGQVVLTINGSTGSTATTTSATTANSTAGTTATEMAGAAVPVFDSGGIQIGVASVNPVTNATELVGTNGAILGVVAQQNSSVVLVGSGNAVLGSFAVSQATGQVLFTASSTS